MWVCDGVSICRAGFRAVGGGGGTHLERGLLEGLHGGLLVAWAGLAQTTVGGSRAWRQMRHFLLSVSRLRPGMEGGPGKVPLQPTQT